MGDVLSLIEDAQAKLDENAARKAAEKMMQNRFDLNDLLETVRAGEEDGAAEERHFQAAGHG